MKLHGWKGAWVLALLLLSAALAMGCSRSSESQSAENSGSSVAVDSAMPEAAKAESSTAAPPQRGAGIGSSVPNVAATPARMLIYKANLTMEVESYTEAYTAVQNIIHLSGGYIVQFSEQSSDIERTGVFTVKVPAGEFNGFIQNIEGIPNRSLNRSMTAQDVSEEYVDLEARLKAKEVVEGRLLSFMEGATKTDDLVTFSNELAAVQQEIEQLKGRMRFLEGNVAFSTVELRMYEKLKPSAVQSLPLQANLSDRMGAALQASLHVLVVVAQAVMIFIAGAIPIVLLVGIIGAPLVWWIRRKAQKTQETKKMDF